MHLKDMELLNMIRTEWIPRINALEKREKELQLLVQTTIKNKSQLEQYIIELRNVQAQLKEFKQYVQHL